MFFCDDDRQRYLELLGKYARKHRLAVQAYCLMTNHVHLVVVPKTEASLAGALKPLHTIYSQHVNFTQGLSGRLWQGRFFSCPLDDEHAIAALRYVERNPVRAGLVAVAEDYLWSSAPAHCGDGTDPVINDALEMPAWLTTPDQWSGWLREPWEPEEAATSRLRRCTRSGRPAGGTTFLDHVESVAGRVLRAGKVGRPGIN